MKDLSELNLMEVEAERFAFSLQTFPKATVLGSLLKAKGEIKEIEADIEAGIVEVSEYIDVLMCVFDAAQRAGITLEEITQGYKTKFIVNTVRRWNDNGDGTYSHVK